MQISTVVAEKELGLRQALRTMGMTDAAYWLSWAAWDVTLAFFTAHAICIFGEAPARLPAWGCVGAGLTPRPCCILGEGAALGDGGGGLAAVLRATVRWCSLALLCAPHCSTLTHLISHDLASTADTHSSTPQTAPPPS